MNRFRIESFVTLFHLNPARRLIALERISTMAAALPAAAVLQPFLAAAIQQQHDVLALIEQWRLSKEGRMHADGARETDSRLDQLLSALRNNLLTISQNFGPDRAKIAEALLEDLFPDGVTFFTRRTFVEQHAALRVLIGKLREERRLSALRSIDLLSWVDRLDEINAVFGKQISQPSQAISRDAIRAADRRAFSGTAQVVAVVLGMYPTNSEIDMAGRIALLSPLIEQEEEFSLLRARRRSGTPKTTGASPGAGPTSTDKLEEELALEEISSKNAPESNTPPQESPPGAVPEPAPLPIGS